RAMTEPAASAAAKVIERRIPVAPGVELYVELRVGNKSAVPFVLVHGLASNARLWDGVAEHLHAAGHTVVVIDQRGHGLSDAPDAGYDLDTAGGGLFRPLGTRGLARPALAGPGLGGPAQTGGGAWDRLRRRRGHRALARVSGVGRLSGGAHTAGARSPDARRPRDADSQGRASLQRSRRRGVSRLLPHATRRDDPGAL